VHELHSLSPRVAQLVNWPSQCNESLAKSFMIAAVCVCHQQLMDKVLIASLHRHNSILIIIIIITIICLQSSTHKEHGLLVNYSKVKMMHSIEQTDLDCNTLSIYLFICLIQVTQSTISKEQELNGKVHRALTTAHSIVVAG